MMSKKVLTSLFLLSIISSSSSYAMPYFSKDRGENIEMSRYVPASIFDNGEPQDVDRPNKASLKKKALIGVVTTLALLGGGAAAGATYSIMSQSNSVTSENFYTSPGTPSTLSAGERFSTPSARWASTPDFQSTHAPQPSHSIERSPFLDRRRALKEEYRKDFLQSYFQSSQKIPGYNIHTPYDLLRDLSKPGGFSVDPQKLYFYLQMNSDKTYKEKASDIFQKGYNNFNNVLLREIKLTLDRWSVEDLCQYAADLPKNDFSKEERKKYNEAVSISQNLGHPESECKNIFEKLPERHKISFLETPFFLDNYEPIKQYLLYKTNSDFRPKKSADDGVQDQVVFDEMRGPAYTAYKGSISHNRRGPTHRDMKGENKSHRGANPSRYPQNAMGKR